MYRHLHSKRCTCINGCDVEASDGSRKIINYSISTATDRKSSITTRSLNPNSISRTRSAPRMSKACDVEHAAKPMHPVCSQLIVSDSCVESFPTEQANRQKERKQAGIAVVKRKQVVEQHWDDVGDDLSSIQVDSSEVFAHVLRRQQDNSLFNFEYSLFSFMLNMPPGRIDEVPNCFASISEIIPVVTNFQCANPSHVHVCELFGGEGLTSKLCSKLFGLKSGRNFEIACGIDLSTPAGRSDLQHYLEGFRPDIVVMAPPCKGFGPWSHLNAVIHPEAVASAKKEGIPLAKLCADVAEFQLNHQRHFLLEQPRNSTLFSLNAWKNLKDRLHVAHCDQCRFGLVDRNNRPLKKPTKFVASSKILLSHIQDHYCRGQHAHGKVVSESERWPFQLCKRIAMGISDLLCEHVPSSNKAFLYFPTFNCPGCRSHLRKDDPKHVRDETCRYKDEISYEWTCPACQRNRPRAHATHTLGPDCRWALARTQSEGGGRVRRGAHPRDPAVPASSDPTSSLRISEETVPVPSRRPPDNVDSEAVEPERLTPEQAARRRRDKRSTEVQAGMDHELFDASQDVEPPHRHPASSADGVDHVVPELAEAEEGEQPIWSKFDLGTSLQLLRSVRLGVVRRTLRKLHIRWYHAPDKRMRLLLTTAGVPSSVIGMVSDIVSTCDICRSWSRPGARSVTSTKIPDRFNAEVEMDLLFVGSHTILHMIDPCIRWSVAIKIADKSTDSILNGIRDGWLHQYGSPQLLISDQEGGLNEFASAIMEQLNIQLHLKAKGQHAAIVERHNELLRRQIHLIDGKATADGLRVSFQQVLTEATFAKNVLLQYGGYSPYEALYGRTPPLLDVLSHEDDEHREHPTRLREIAVQAMMQAAAEDRIKRANHTKTRPAGDLQGLEIGDLVDIYRPTLSKDVPRWNGPATVTDLTSLPDGQIGVRWQGRNLQVRVQDCRRALAYVFVPILFGGGSSPIEILRRAAETFQGVMRVGWIKHNSTWLPCEGNSSFSDILHAGLYVSAINLQLVGVFSFRFGSNIKTLSGIHCDEALLCWWQPPNFQAWNHAFVDGAKAINLVNLCGSENVSFIQFLMEDGIAIDQLRKLNTDIANIGGVHDPRMPIIREIPMFDSKPRLSRKVKMISDKQRDSTIPTTTHNETSITATLNDSDIAVPIDEGPIADNDQVEFQSDEGQDREPTETVGWVCAAYPPLSACQIPLDDNVFIIDEDNEPAELEISTELCPYLTSVSLPSSPDEPHFVVFQYHSENSSVSDNPSVVIERTHNVLTRQQW